MKACLLVLLIYSNSARIELSNHIIMKTPNPLPAGLFSLPRPCHPLSSRPFFRPRRANRDHSSSGKANTATKFIMTGPNSRQVHLANHSQRRRGQDGQPLRHSRRPSQPNRSPVHFRLRSRWQIRPCLRQTIPGRRTRIGEIRREGNEEFLYVRATKRGRHSPSSPSRGNGLRKTAPRWTAGSTARARMDPKR